MPENFYDNKEKINYNFYYFNILVSMANDLKKINRKTDSLLDWLGNWGGLLDGLSFIGRHLISNYTLYALNS